MRVRAKNAQFVTSRETERGEEGRERMIFGCELKHNKCAKPVPVLYLPFWLKKHGAEIKQRRYKRGYLSSAVSVPRRKKLARGIQKGG